MNHLIVSITFLFALSDALAVEFDNTVLLRGVVQESYGPSAQSSEDEFAFYYNATFRDVLEVNVNNQIELHSNILLLSQTLMDTGVASSVNLANDYRFRSTKLEYDRIYENTDNTLQFDKLYGVFYSKDASFSLKLGRQALNLSVGMFFTPNDFFIPFLVTQLYRIYKPGVDALVMSYDANATTQFNLVTVLGYNYDAETQKNVAYLDRTSLVANVSFNLSSSTLNVLGGHVYDHYVVGAALQKDIFLGLFLRLEGNYNFGGDLQNNDSQVSVSIETQMSDSITFVAEYFYHERGATDVSDYLSSAGGLQLPYLGRHYLAVAPSWQMSPLWMLSTSWMISAVDWSSQLSLRAEYSLANESTVAINGVFSTGEKSEGEYVPININSEFGSSPSLSVSSLTIICD